MDPNTRQREASKGTRSEICPNPKSKIQGSKGAASKNEGKEKISDEDRP